MIHNQENFIIFRGFNTKGLFLIEELPVIPSAKEKKTFIEIDGRHGFLTNSQEVLEKYFQHFIFLACVGNNIICIFLFFYSCSLNIPAFIFI